MFVESTFTNRKKNRTSCVQSTVMQTIRLTNTFTQEYDVRCGDAADASGRGAHADAQVPQDGGIQLRRVDVDHTVGHGEAKLTGHL